MGATAGEPRHTGAASLHTRLSDVPRVLWRALRTTIDHGLVNVAKAVAFSLFIAIPSGLLLVLGIFGLVASPAEVDRVATSLHGVLPDAVTRLLRAEIVQVTSSRSTSAALLIVGLLLALWSFTGAMTTLMWGLNMAYGARETRGFVQQRLTAIVLVGGSLIAFSAVFLLLILGPYVERWLGRVTGSPGTVRSVWWVLEWPGLVVVLLAFFALMLYAGPNTVPRRLRLLTPGAVVATVLWLAVSGAFALYSSHLGGYNKSWGSLAAVVILLIWLWLTSLAILIGAEVNAEFAAPGHRSRE